MPGVFLCIHLIVLFTYSLLWRIIGIWGSITNWAAGEPVASSETATQAGDGGLGLVCSKRTNINWRSFPNHFRATKTLPVSNLTIIISRSNDTHVFLVLHVQLVLHVESKSYNFCFVPVPIWTAGRSARNLSFASWMFVRVCTGKYLGFFNPGSPAETGAVARGHVSIVIISLLCRPRKALVTIRGYAGTGTMYCIVGIFTGRVVSQFSW